MAAKLNPAAVPASRYPLGCRFVPKDSELIRYYLAKKINNETLPISEIHEVNIYQHHPETLAENYAKLGDKEWYFLTPRNRKYKNGHRPDRAAGNGYWRATAADKNIFNDDKSIVVGYKKTLVFYQGKAPNGDKTNWIMHEFRVPDDQSTQTKRNAADIMKLDDWVLCRIYKKDSKAKASTLVAQNNPSDSIEVDVPEVTNNENLTQMTNIQHNIEVGSSSSNSNNSNNYNLSPMVIHDNNNNNYNLSTMVIHDNNTTQVATTNNGCPTLPDDPFSFEDMDWLQEHYDDFLDDPYFENDILQNVPEASAPHINLDFDSGPNPFGQPSNLLEPSSLDLEGWDTQQQGHAQDQEGSCNLLKKGISKLSQTDPSDFGNPSGNLHD